MLLQKGALAASGASGKPLTDTVMDRPSQVTLLLMMSAVSTALGNSLQSISVFTWCQPILLLRALYLCAAMPLSASQWSLIVSVIFVTHILGGTLAFAGIFNAPDWTFSGVLLASLIAATLLLIILPATFLATLRFHQRFQNSWLETGVFAVLWTATWSLICSLGPFGWFASPASSLTDSETLVQAVALLGVPAAVLSGLLFLVGWVAGLANMLWSHLSPPGLTVSAPTAMNSHTQALAGVLLAMLAYGGGRAHSDAFYQRSVQVTYVPTLAASCILGSTSPQDGALAEKIWQATEKQIRAEDDIVMWSEAVIAVGGDGGEAKLLDRASSLLKAVGNNRTLLGVTYVKQMKLEQAYNMFALVAPDGSLAWKYAKSHPVPFIERDVMPGVPDLPTYDAPFGRLGGAICFDLDFPEFARQAGRKQVDIVLQPSWTWGSIGARHFEGNALRAVENGFTIFRCSSYGVSGVVSPYKRYFHWVPTLGEGTVEMAIPMHRRVLTMYTWAGFCFEWVMVALAVLLWAIILCPEHVLGKTRAYGFRNYLLWGQTNHPSEQSDGYDPLVRTSTANNMHQYS